MWLNLTFYNGDPIVINFLLVEAMQPTNENKAKTAISTANGSWQVRETMEEIDQMLRSTVKPSIVNLGPLPKEWR